MLLSIDSRGYLLSRIKGDVKNKNHFYNNKYILKLLGAGSGPQEFIAELSNQINKSKSIKTTCNFLKSDIHLLNLGCYSPLWKYFQCKNSKKIIIRFDGGGIDNTKNISEAKNNLNKIMQKGNYVIFQSRFCRNFFKNEFGYLPNNIVIHNGAKKLYKSKKRGQNFSKESIGIPQNENYFVVAGRFTRRKRIKETITFFRELNKYNLVVLSNIPKKEIIKSKRIKYLGMQNPFVAKQIISNSRALIHMDCYDWCPNIIISAIVDGVPVICSNYGGSPELVKKNGIIIQEFPKDLYSNLDGINFTLNSKFPDYLLESALEKIIFDRKERKYISNYSIENCAEKYIKSILKYQKKMK